jgi:hypothetical protein
LWVSTAEQLLQRTSSAEPTPGGGAIAAVTAAFGVGLVHMALEVTLAAPVSSPAELTYRPPSPRPPMPMSTSSMH